MFSRTIKSTLQLTTRRTYSTSKPTNSSSVESAQKVLGSAAEKGTAVWKSTVEKVGNSLGSYKEPILGNAAVAREVLKQVYVAEKLAPPTLAQISYTYSSFFSSAKNASFWKNMIQSGEWKKYGIYAIEAYGIMKIGEMIGRRHIVGYKLDEKTVGVAAAH